MRVCIDRGSSGVCQVRYSTLASHQTAELQVLTLAEDGRDDGKIMFAFRITF